jgi:hypothetical protein
MSKRITAEDLMKNSSKKNAQDYWDSYVARYKHDPAHHRHPDTIMGFITKEKLAEIYTKPNNRLLIMAIGLIIVSDGTVCFFTDDPTFGLGALPTSFQGSFIHGISYEFGEGKQYEDVDAILANFAPGDRHLNSMEELLKYLNKE